MSSPETLPVPPFGTVAPLLPNKRDGVLACDVGNELLLYDRRSDTAISLNLTAAAVWDLCDGTSTVAEIVRDVSEMIGASPEVWGGEIERVVHDLSALGLLVPFAPEAAAGS